MHPQALYKMRSNDHSFIAKVDSGASRNCISKLLWNRIKVSSKLAKPNVVLTGAGGSKLSLLVSWPENQGILFFYISKTLQMIRISFMAFLLNAVL